MGAKCCTSEGAAGARRERLLEAADADDGGVQVETAENLKDEGTPGTPLWQLEAEEAKTAAESAPPPPEPPLPPPQKEPEATVGEGAVQATASSDKHARGRPGRSTNPEGKARARSRARQDAEAAKSGAEAGAKGGAEGAKPAAKAAPKAAAAKHAPAPAPAAAAPPPKAAEEEPRQSVAGGSLYHVLKINILSARELRNADTAPGKSDPYCIMEIPGKSSSKFRTKTITDTLDPYWCQTVELSGFDNADSLVFSVYDKDMLTADDVLGKAVLKKEDIIPSGFKGELKLHDKLDSKDKRGVGKLEVHATLVRSYCVGGKVKPTVKEVQPGTDEKADLREATITIYSGADLPNKDWGLANGKSDPYVVVEVPGKPKTQFRTPHVMNSLKPQWDFTGTIKDYAIGDPILFTVWDKDNIKKDDFLGRATLDGSDVDVGFYGEVKLSHGGSLKIKIKVSEGKGGEADAAQPAEQAAEQRPPAKSAEHAKEPKKEKAKEAEEPKKAKEGEASPEASPQALLEAAEKGDAKAVKKLLAHGVALDAANADGQSVLHICVARKHEDLVARLLQQKGKRKLLSMRTREAKDTALHCAARDDLKAICVMLVKEGANVRSKNGAGKMPHELAKGELAQWLQVEDPAGTAPPWQK